MPGTVIIKPIQAKLGVKDEHLMAKLDPYCVAIVSDHYVEGQVCKKGGAQPVWEDSLAIHVGNEPYCYLEVKDKRILMDKMLGVCAIDLEELTAGGNTQKWYELYNKRLPVGEILIEARLAPGDLENTTPGFTPGGFTPGFSNEFTREEQYPYDRNETPHAQAIPQRMGTGMSHLNEELQEMNQRIDFMINRTKALAQHAGGVGQLPVYESGSYAGFSGREGTPYIPEISSTQASHGRFSGEGPKQGGYYNPYPNHSAEVSVRSTLTPTPDHAKELKQKIANQIAENEGRGRSLLSSGEPGGRERSSSRGLKEKMLEGVERWAHHSIERLQDVEDWAGREKNPYQSQLPHELYRHHHNNNNRPLMSNQEIQTDISFHPGRDLLKYAQGQQELQGEEEAGYVSSSESGGGQGQEQQKRRHPQAQQINEREETQRERFDEKIEYETGQDPQESIYNLGGSESERFRIAVSGPKDETLYQEQRRPGGFLEKVKEKVQEGVDAVKHLLPQHEEKEKEKRSSLPNDATEQQHPSLLERAKEKIFGKSPNKKEDLLTPSKSEQVLFKSPNRTPVSPSVQHREGVDIISIPIDLYSPGGGEVFEGLKRRYIPQEIYAANEPRFSQVMHELNSLPVSFLWENQGAEQVKESFAPEGYTGIQEEDEDQEEEQIDKELDVVADLMNAVVERALMEAEAEAEEMEQEEREKRGGLQVANPNLAQEINLLDADNDEEEEQMLEEKLEQIEEIAEAAQEMGLLDAKGDILVDDYQIDVDVQELPHGQAVTTREEFVLRPIENLMDQEEEGVKVSLTEKVTIETFDEDENEEEREQDQQPVNRLVEEDNKEHIGQIDLMNDNKENVAPPSGNVIGSDPAFSNEGYLEMGKTQNVYNFSLL